jgi:hypothetical protein
MGNQESKKEKNKKAPEYYNNPQEVNNKNDSK